MKNVSFLPRGFNIIGLVLILLSSILILTDLISGYSLYEEYASIVCFVGMLVSIVARGNEEIKYRAVFIAARNYVIIKILTVVIIIT